jgi:hypothetical protein
MAMRFSYIHSLWFLVMKCIFFLLRRRRRRLFLIFPLKHKKKFITNIRSPLPAIAQSNTKKTKQNLSFDTHINSRSTKILSLLLCELLLHSFQRKNEMKTEKQSFFFSSQRVLCVWFHVFFSAHYSLHLTTTKHDFDYSTRSFVVALPSLSNSSKIQYSSIHEERQNTASKTVLDPKLKRLYDFNESRSIFCI